MFPMLSTYRPAQRPAERKSATLRTYFREYIPNIITTAVGIMTISQSIQLILPFLSRYQKRVFAEIISGVQSR